MQILYIKSEFDLLKVLSLWRVSRRRVSADGGCQQTEGVSRQRGSADGRSPNTYQILPMDVWLRWKTFSFEQMRQYHDAQDPSFEMPEKNTSHLVIIHTQGWIQESLNSIVAAKTWHWEKCFAALHDSVPAFGLPAKGTSANGRQWLPPIDDADVVVLLIILYYYVYVNKLLSYW